MEIENLQGWFVPRDEIQYKKEMSTEASKRDNDTELKTNNTHKTFANAWDNFSPWPVSS